MIEVELLIVGAGPGGMTAALTAARHGLKTLVLDDNPAPGGQIYRPSVDLPGRARPGAGDPNLIKGERLKAEFKALGREVTRLQRATVWGFFPDNIVGVAQSNRSFAVKYHKMIIAAGAHDRPVAFPGWTLPGVYTAGGAQRLVKTMGVLPGKKILLAGTGPLQIALAAQILRAGGRIAAVLEAGRIPNPLPFIPGMALNPDQVGELAGYLKTLLAHRTTIKTGRLIVEARGDGRLEEVVTARIDRQWHEIPGRRQTFAVDTLCLGYGLVPAAELTLQAGCRHEYRPSLGGWVPVRDRFGRTTVEDVYAVGDGAGVWGSRTAILAGRQAALCAAHELGRLDRTELLSQSRPIQQALGRLARLKHPLDRMTTPGPGLYELADAETIICRCEGVTWGQIQSVLDGREFNLNEIKRLTRVGMGRCQGKICGSILAGLEADLPEPFLRRPPIRPVPLGVLANEADPEELEADHAA